MAGAAAGAGAGATGFAGVGGRITGVRGRWSGELRCNVGSSSPIGGREGKLGSGRFVSGAAGSDGGMLDVWFSWRASSAAAFMRLCSFQHAGQRHSTMNAPSGVRVRVRRQPNWLLMSV